MIARRLPFVVVGAALVTLLFADRAAPEPLPPSTYGEDPLAQSTPAVFEGDLLSTSWFCPGGPTVDGRSTSLTIFNSTNDPADFSLSVDGGKSFGALASLTVVWFDVSPTVAVSVGTAAGMAAQTRLIVTPVLLATLLVGSQGLDTVPAAVLATASAWLVMALVDRRNERATVGVPPTTV